MHCLLQRLQFDALFRFSSTTAHIVRPNKTMHFNTKRIQISRLSRLTSETKWRNRKKSGPENSGGLHEKLPSRVTIWENKNSGTNAI